MQLNSSCTPVEFSMKFLNKLMIGLSDGMTCSDFAICTLKRTCRKCGNRFEVEENEKICSMCKSIRNNIKR